MSDKVTSIRGHPLPTPGEPVEDVVDTLRRLLEMAESGEIVGFVGVTLHADNAVSGYSIGQTHWHSVRGYLFKLATEL